MKQFWNIKTVFNIKEKPFDTLAPASFILRLSVTASSQDLIFIALEWCVHDRPSDRLG